MNNLPPRRNIKLIIAYTGAAYHGWQRQVRELDTVQQLIERAASRLVGHPVIIFGASRTDAGVHAEGQSANFYTTNMSIPMRGLRRAMNSKLPLDIAVRSAVEVDKSFNASRSATGKTYRYRIHVAPTRPVSLHRQVYHYWRTLDIAAMQQAADRLVGTHDFRGFASSAEKRKSTVRTISRCELTEVGQEVHVTVAGDGFLYKMVRNIVGTLIEVGRGRYSADQINLIITSRQRRNAGPTAPPDGLTLMALHYE